LGAGFLEKNRDTLSADLLQVIQASSFKFVTSMFKEDFAAVRITSTWTMHNSSRPNCGKMTRLDLLTYCSTYCLWRVGVPAYALTLR